MHREYPFCADRSHGAYYPDIQRYRLVAA
jgi:hypothetical protein